MKAILRKKDLTRIVYRGQRLFRLIRGNKDSVLNEYLCVLPAVTDDRSTSDGLPPVHYAIKHKAYHALRVLLRYQDLFPQRNEIDAQGREPIERAIDDEDLDAVKILLNSGAPMVKKRKWHRLLLRARAGHVQFLTGLFIAFKNRFFSRVPLETLLPHIPDTEVRGKISDYLEKRDEARKLAKTPCIRYASLIYGGTPACQRGDYGS